MDTTTSTTTFSNTGHDNGSATGGRTRTGFRRSSEHKLLGGVCGGLARTLNLDVALVRVLAVILAVVTNGIGALAYLAAWLIIPEDGSDTAPLASWLRR